MPDSIRTKIVAAVIARMQTILKSGGYNTDLGKNVSHWRGTDYTDAELAAAPQCNIKDTDQDDQSQVSRHHDHTLAVEVIVVLASGAQTVQVCDQIDSDIYEAIGVDERWGLGAGGAPMAIRSLQGKTERETTQDKLKIMATRRTFTIVYRTLLWDAYNQG